MNRAANLLTLQSTQFDLLVIGGGITGAGIALDAAARGLKTVLQMCPVITMYGLSMVR